MTDGERRDDFVISGVPVTCQFSVMHVERLKYIIWAADTARAVTFYTTVFGGKVIRENPAVTDIEISGGIIGV
ncbi:MAG: hypothetical protein EBR40_09620, partial [Proteobacteria bacterium]|nr:hypothetical protein [Pseudomonadota bacterium]